MNTWGIIILLFLALVNLFAWGFTRNGLNLFAAGFVLGGILYMLPRKE